MKKNTPLLIAIISVLAASSVRAQNFRQPEPAFDFVRKGSLLTVKSASGEELTTIDLDKPAFKGKVIAVTYSSKKKKVEEQPENAGMVTVFPNPSSKLVNVKLNGDKWRLPAQLQIFSKTGTLIETTTLENAKSSVDISALPQGVYIMKIETSTAKAVEKLVVQ